MNVTHAADLTDQIDRLCVPLNGDDHDYDDLLDAVGDRSIVLLGEATHGTHDFYRERARITRRLIEERGALRSVLGSIARRHPRFIHARRFAYVVAVRDRFQARDLAG